MQARIAVLASAAPRQPPARTPLFRRAGAASQRFLGEASRVAISDFTTAAASRFPPARPDRRGPAGGAGHARLQRQQECGQEGRPGPGAGDGKHRRARHRAGHHHGDRQRRADPDGGDQIADRRRDRRRARPRRRGRQPRASSCSSWTTATCRHNSSNWRRPRRATARCSPTPNRSSNAIRTCWPRASSPRRPTPRPRPPATRPKLPSPPTTPQSRRRAFSSPIPSCARRSAGGPAR